MHVSRVIPAARSLSAGLCLPFRAMTTSTASRFRLDRASTALFLCDIQEKFAPHIANFDSVAATARKMVAAGAELDLPLIVTEQNPRALGPTLPSIDVSGAKLKVAKTLFSMCVPEVEQKLKELGTKHVVLFGIESHVCVTQTALDLLSMGHEVVVLADGVSSMNSAEVPLALQRLRDAGAQVASSESILFQLVKDAGDAKFKAISGLVKAFKTETTKALDDLVLRK